MQTLQNKVAKELSDEVAPVIIKKGEEVIIKKADVTISKLQKDTMGRNISNLWSKIFGTTNAKGIDKTRQSAVRNFFQNQKPPITTLSEVETLLTRLWGQDKVSLRYSMEEIINLIGVSIEKGEVLPPGVLDEIIGISLRSTKKWDMLKYLTSPNLRRLAKNGNLTDDQIKHLIGNSNFNSTIKSSVMELLTAKTIGGTLIKIWKNTFGRLAKLKWQYWVSGLAITIIGGIFLDMYVKLTASKKAIAGLTPDFYKKFSGFKEMIYTKGGLTDPEAEALAAKLHGYLRGMMIWRDLNEKNNLENKITSYKHRLYPEDWPKTHATSIAEIPDEDRQEFLDWLKGQLSSVEQGFWTSGILWEGNEFWKSLIGVDDKDILAVIRVAPTVLAMSHITYYYNQLGDYTLIEDINLMASKLPWIGSVKNYFTKTQQDVYKMVGEKEWHVGSEAGDDDIAIAITRMVKFWPAYAPSRKSDGTNTDWEAGETIYCRYKDGALISTDNLNRISQAFDWSPIGTEETDWEPQDFQEWLNSLSAEKFNKGQCYDLGKGCDKPYFTANEKHEDRRKLKGVQIEELKKSFSGMIDDMYKAWKDNGFKGLKDFWDGGDSDDIDIDKEETETEGEPMEEGLIRVLKRLL